MLNWRCPRCHTYRRVREGSRATCVQCGYGKRWTPGMGRATQEQGQGLWVVAVLGTVGVLVVGGVALYAFGTVPDFSGPQVVPPDHTPVVSAFFADLVAGKSNASEIGGSFRGTLMPTADWLPELGRVTIDFVVRYGPNNTSVQLDDGVRAWTVTCGQRGLVVASGGEVARERRLGTMSPCRSLWEMASFMGFPRLPTDLAGFDAGEARPGFDGDTQVWVGRNEIVTAVVDDGRVAHASLDGGGWLLTLVPAFEERSVVVMPDASENRSAVVHATASFERTPEFGRYTWVVTESPHAPPLSEMQVQIRSTADRSLLMRADFVEGEGEDQGFSFVIQDADDDFRLTPGDRVQITHPDWQEADEAYLVLVDLWALDPTRQNLTPVPPWVAFGAIIVALGAVRPRFR